MVRPAFIVLTSHQEQRAFVTWRRELVDRAAENTPPPADLIYFDASLHSHNPPVATVPVHSNVQPCGSVLAETSDIAASAIPDETPGAGPPLIVVIVTRDDLRSGHEPHGYNVLQRHHRGLSVADVDAFQMEISRRSFAWACRLTCQVRSEDLK